MSSTEELSLVTRSAQPYTASRDSSGLDTPPPEAADATHNSQQQDDVSASRRKSEEPSVIPFNDDLLADTHETAMQVRISSRSHLLP